MASHISLSEHTTYLSERAHKLARTNNNLLWDVLGDLWDPETNPHGYASLGVADNALLQSELLQLVKDAFQPEVKFLTYNEGPSGSRDLRATLARFLSSQLKTHRPLRSENLSVTNGVSAATEHAAWALCNAGEAILLARPYYRSFAKDLCLRPGAQIVELTFGNVDSFGVSALKVYEDAIMLRKENEPPIRAILLCNPHNPLGRCYSRSFLRGLLELCQRHSIHLISDEIYALSVWRGGEDSDGGLQGFTSILSFDFKDLIDPSLVHVLWGTSKDLGANGLRLGLIISENPDLLEAARALSLYSCASGLVDQVSTRLFADDGPMYAYVGKNREALFEAYTYMSDLLRRHGIKHTLDSNAGLFIWCDLLSADRYDHGHSLASTFEQSWERHQALAQRLLAAKVYIGDGQAFGSEDPGWFRITFSQPKDIVNETIRRIVLVLQRDSNA